jgi:DtxR family Mn-dependent transcriptional regulator
MSRSKHQAGEGAAVRADLRTLAALEPGTRGRVARVTRDLTGRAERLAALGVSPGAAIRVLQTFPGIVFECDQTEMAVERAVARVIFVDVTQ